MTPELFDALQSMILAICMVFITWVNNRTKRALPLPPEDMKEHQNKAILSLVKLDEDEQEVVLVFVRKYQQAVKDSQWQPSDETIKSMEVGWRLK